TTGIYCRPSCPARRPQRRNVQFHRTPGDAERAGFRACERCRPKELSIDQDNAAAVARACRLVTQAEKPLSLAILADAAGLSQSHFHRVFKALLGLTPKAYATAHRAQRTRDALSKSATVTSAIYNGGFNSNGRFYATSSKV